MLKNFFAPIIFIEFQFEFLRRLAIGLSMVLLSACHMYGDTADDLDVHDSGVVDSQLTGSWATSAGNVITIQSDSSTYDSTCSQSGSVKYVSRQYNCPAGVTNCGSLTLTRAPYNSSTGCYGHEEYSCMFNAAINGSDRTMTLVCSGEHANFGLSYRGI